MPSAFIFPVIAAFVAGAALAWWFSTGSERAKRALLEHAARDFQARWAEAHEELTKARDALRQAGENVAAQQAQIARLEERADAEKRASEQVLEQMRKGLPDTFKALAGAVLEEKAKTLSEQNLQNLDQVLAPLNTRLQGFQQKIEQVHLDQVRGEATLREQVKTMVDSTTAIGRQADDLAQALRGSNKAQGSWGELVLARILESAGLREGVEYDAQESYTVEDGRRLQPDVVIHLPEGREIVVDSKVSLTAYEACCRAENDGSRAEALSALVTSVRAHIKALSSKNYQSLYGFNSLDFVIMFLPVEPAFALALSSDETLLDRAWKQNVLLVGPSTLLFVVRTVAYLWRQEQQRRNVEQIAQEGAELYNKLTGFVTDLMKIGTRLHQAQGSYGEAIKKLSTGTGSLIGRAEKLRALGIKPTKELPRDLVARAQDLELTDSSLEISAPDDAEISGDISESMLNASFGPVPDRES